MFSENLFTFVAEFNKKLSFHELAKGSNKDNRLDVVLHSLKTKDYLPLSTFEGFLKNFNSYFFKGKFWNRLHKDELEYIWTVWKQDFSMDSQFCTLIKEVRRENYTEYLYLLSHHRLVEARRYFFETLQPKFKKYSEEAFDCFPHDAKEQMGAFMEAVKAYKPSFIKNWKEYRNFKDSTAVAGQLPAQYAALSILGKNKKARILYVASSYGLGMRMLKLAGFENVYGIDLSESGLKFCKSQGLSVTKMDAKKLNFKDDTFDLVISRDFVEGLYFSKEEDNVKIMNEMHRVTKKDGFVVFTTMLPVIGKVRGLPLPDHIKKSNLKKIFYEDGYRVHGRGLPIYVFRKGL